MMCVDYEMATMDTHSPGGAGAWLTGVEKVERAAAQRVVIV